MTWRDGGAVLQHLEPEQHEVDQYLPELDLPHRLSHENPNCVGGLAWPQETMSQRAATASNSYNPRCTSV